MRLRDKVALIVGAGGPIGTAVSVLFAREGAKVVLAARREEPLRKLAGHIRHFGGEASYVTGDALTAEGAKGMVAHALNCYGRLDILYNNVGAYSFGEKGIEELVEEEWHSLIAINLTSAYLPCHFAVPVMKEKGGGVILNVAASLRLRRASNAGYAAAKEGIIGLTLHLARVLKPFDIRVHCLCPGNIGPLKGADRIALPTPTLNRPGEPEDVAYGALFLCSDESAWLTGVILEIDGGASLFVGDERREA